MTPLLTRISAPAALPVSLEELKAHLRIEHADEDAALTRLLGAATSALDGPTGQLGRCLMRQTWRCAFPRGRGRRLVLPIVPAVALTAVSRIDPAGAAEALDPADYVLAADLDRSWVEPVTPGWPAVADRPDALAFELTAGAADPAEIPEALRHAILLLAGHWHAHREAVADRQAAELPLGVQHLVALHRICWAA